MPYFRPSNPRVLAKNVCTIITPKCLKHYNEQVFATLRVNVKLQGTGQIGTEVGQKQGMKQSLFQGISKSSDLLEIGKHTEHIKHKKIYGISNEYIKSASLISSSCNVACKYRVTGHTGELSGNGIKKMHTNLSLLGKLTLCVYIRRRFIHCIIQTSRYKNLS